MQSLKSKTSELEAVLDGMERKPLYVAITEHWYTRMEIQCMNIRGYQRISAFGREGRMHGGSGIFVAECVGDSLEVTEIVEKSVDGDLECSSILSKSSRLIIICIYRPPGGNMDVFFVNLAEILDRCQSHYRNYRVVLAGDFNINLMEHSYASKCFRDLLWSFNFSQTINEPTRISRASASLLDNIFINFLNAYQGEVVTTALSDHEAQVLCISCTVTPAGSFFPYKKRIFSVSKVSQFKYEVGLLHWQTLYTCKDANIAYNIFDDAFGNLFRLIFVERMIRTPRAEQKSWLTKGIRVSLKNKRLMYKRMQQGKLSREAFKIYSRVLKAVISESKRREHLRYIKTSKNPGKAIWTLVKWYRGTEGDKKESLLENMHENYPTKSKTDILNTANEFFINACPDLNVNLDSVTERIVSHNKNLFLTPTSPAEVKQIVLSLKDKKSVGKDQIPVMLIKNVVEEIAGPLSYLINLSISTGVFPDRLKTAQIRPIYKKGKRDEMENYRPIALLNNFSKIFERVIFERIISFLENERILSSSQNGFRKGRSTARAVYQALVGILDSMNLKKETIAVCLDLSKAFDSVNYGLLIAKLERYGIRGIPLKLISSYLSGRTQHVIDRDGGQMVSSDTRRVNKGIPQGSILGPLLYIVYTNELPNTIDHNMVQFADDTTVIFSIDDGENTSNEICVTLDYLQMWFAANNLLLNVDKTQLVRFSYQKDWTPTQYICDKMSLKTQKTAKFLGLTIDSRLDWAGHVDSLAKSLAQNCFALGVLARSINIEAGLTAYHAYVHSRIRYGIIFWCGSSEAARILLLQKRCLRKIFRMQQMESCRTVFVTHRILTVVSMYILESIIFIKQNSDLFEDHSRTHSYDTRQKEDLLNIRSNFTYLQKNVQFSIMKIFNKLPLSLRSLNLHLLRKRLREVLQRRAYYGIEEYYCDDFCDVV